jgi:hypothetical protein
MDDFDDFKGARRGRKSPGRFIPRGSPLREKYIDARVQGFSPKQAAKRAGYATPNEWETLEKHPEVIKALTKLEEQVSKDITRKFTREKVLELVDEGLEMSRSARDPMAFFRGVQEVNKMQGHYAPEKRELALAPELDALRGQLAEMSEADLLEKLGGEKGITVDGEFKVVEEAKSP